MPYEGSPRESHPAANVYQQDELRGDNKVEHSPRNRVALFAGNKVELLPFHKAALNLALE